MEEVFKETINRLEAIRLYSIDQMVKNNHYPFFCDRWKLNRDRVMRMKEEIRMIEIHFKELNEHGKD